MKYTYLFIIAFIFLGAGCTDLEQNTTQIDSSTSVETVKEEQIESEEEELPEAGEETENSEAEESVETNTESTTSVIVDDVIQGNISSKTQTFSMTSGNFFFDPNVITVDAGTEITIDIEANSGTHTFVIDELGVKETIAAGQGFTFTAPNETGSYPFYCDIGSHRALGMEGVLIVE